MIFKITAMTCTAYSGEAKRQLRTADIARGAQLNGAKIQLDIDMDRRTDRDDIRTC